MLIKKHIMILSLCTLSLTGCMTDGTNAFNNETQPTTTPGSMLYPEGYETVSEPSFPSENQTIEPIPLSENVVVPESYHVGAYHSPVSPKDADRSWVSGQNPQAYTIQIAQGEKASQVAAALMKLPKGEHTAEVPYQQGQRTYYRGLYGSYPNYEAAQQALSQLPEEVKQQAGIQSFSSVQGNMN